MRIWAACAGSDCWWLWGRSGVSIDTPVTPSRGQEGEEVLAGVSRSCGGCSTEAAGTVGARRITLMIL